MHRATSDPELVRAARRGERRAFALLIDRHHPALLSSCRRMGGRSELARDAAQEAVLRAMLGLHGLRRDDRFREWLIGIGLNVCRSMLASGETPTGEVEPDAAPDRAVVAGPEERVLTDELGVRVRAAIAALPEGQRAAVTLFYLAGLTQAEIAAGIGIPPGAVKTRLYKARRSLRLSLHATYQEYFDMTDSAIPVRVCELRRTTADPPRHIVLLETDVEPTRRLPIWIGQPEATWLPLILEQVEMPRPGVYQFAASLLRASGAQLREVRISQLTESTFFAETVLGDGTVVDSRPSDAVTLALLTGAPISVAPEVLDQAAVDPLGDEHGELLGDVRTPGGDAAAIVADAQARYRAEMAKLD